MERSTRYRFRKENRLLDAAAFGRVFDKRGKARRSSDRLFTDEGPGRLGLAISKKHCKKASARNRIKRVVRESFRQNLERLDGLDIVVMNRVAAATAENAELFASLEKHWSKCEEIAGTDAAS